jgi:hypothetical protein
LIENESSFMMLTMSNCRSAIKKPLICFFIQVMGKWNLWQNGNETKKAKWASVIKLLHSITFQAFKELKSWWITEKFSQYDSSPLQYRWFPGNWHTIQDLCSTSTHYAELWGCKIADLGDAQLRRSELIVFVSSESIICQRDKTCIRAFVVFREIQRLYLRDFPFLITHFYKNRCHWIVFISAWEFRRYWLACFEILTSGFWTLRIR